MPQVRPTVFLGVPRVWEKIREALLKIAATVTGPKKALSTWCKATAAAQVHTKGGGNDVTSER